MTNKVKDINSTVKSNRINDVNTAIRFFIKTIGGLTVLEDNKICYDLNHDPYLVPISSSRKSTNKEVYALADNLPSGNFWVYNPFSGSLAESNVDKNMYNAYRISMSARIVTIVMSILKSALKSKGMEIDNDKYCGDIDCDQKVIVDLLSSKSYDNNKILIDEIDEKSFHEILEYFEFDPRNSSEVVIPVYNRQTKTCSLVVKILEDDFIKKEYPFSFRKKSMYILRNLLGNLLGYDDEEIMESYSVFAKDKTPFKFYSTMKLYLHLYKRLEKVMDLLADETGDPNFQTPDLDEYSDHVERMDEYKKTTAHMIFSAPVESGYDTTETNQEAQQRMNNKTKTFNASKAQHSQVRNVPVSQPVSSQPEERTFNMAEARRNRSMHPTSPAMRGAGFVRLRGQTSWNPQTCSMPDNSAAFPNVSQPVMVNKPVYNARAITSQTQPTVNVTARQPRLRGQF